MQIAKKTGTAIFIVGHVTKEGALAGPKILEHTVDTVLQFEGEKTYSYRILRAIKNRFGSTNEIGIFDMDEQGLREVPNPSEIFLSQRSDSQSGTAIVATIEGTRPLLIEVQALVTSTGYSNPQRTATGFDNRRLQMIIAVLEKRLGINFRDVDVFVNIAGGMTLSDPAVDLAMAAALVSSLRDNPLESDMVIMGEIGLTGEVRSISSIEQRLSEIQKLGFQRVLLPKGNVAKLSRTFEGLTLLPADRIAIALAESVL
jgi:DNA repair protein RadA/Sms